MKNIIVGGMPQAGSTLCFNLIREMIEENGSGVHVKLGNTSSNYKKEGSKTGKVDYNLVKSHIQIPGNFDYKINVRRDIRDSVASNKRKDPSFLGGNVMEIAKRNIDWYNEFVGISNYEFVYENYKNNPNNIIKEISFILGFNLDDNQINNVIDRAESLKDKNLSYTHEWSNDMFNKTLMSQIHITSNKGKIGGYKDTLTEQEIKNLEDKYKNWLTEKGYM
jgi:hypothetical protein